ncbi:MAG: PDZ domain-containing protein [Gemmatimonadaceae bacterium]
MRLSTFPASALLAALLATPAFAQRHPSPVGAAAPTISDVRYDITFDRGAARERRIRVAMSFNPRTNDAVLLSLPVWTPGAYEVTNFAHWLTKFAATGDGRALAWDKTDFETWRVRPAGAKSVTVSFEYIADTLDNGMAWARPDFALVNGTNVFFYPEGKSLDFPSSVVVHTEPEWLVATGLRPGRAARTFHADNYHDLVDMPFFIGRFDLDSMQISERWVRLATYPVGSVAGASRRRAWEHISRVIPPEVAVFGEVPWSGYTVMQITDSLYQGASGLEHQNSHVDVVSPLAVASAFMPSLYAHEIFHSWNVKRLRPADLWPYRYDGPMTTRWLWVSEGITDYYADLAEVRGGVVDSLGFFDLTSGKITEVGVAPPVSLEDASLSTWVHPQDGTGYIYYPKGSLVGLMLDIAIRDASDNHKALDDVMRELYKSAYKAGRGFTGAEWWAAVTRAANGRPFGDFSARYVSGRDPYPWTTILPLAGLRLLSDTTREPRLGVITTVDSAGIRVTGVEPRGAADQGGVREGDYLVAIGDIPVEDATFGQRFRAKYGTATDGGLLPIRVRRGVQTMTLSSRLQFDVRTQARVAVDPSAGAKAARIRHGILTGTVTR